MFRMLSLVVFNIFHVFMLYINDEWNQHVQPSHLTIISAVRWLWKMWYLCRNDKWMCVNSSCGLVIWWMWWWVMNGCHGKLQIEKNVTNNLNTQTHLSTVVVFLFTNWWCTINTLERDTLDTPLSGDGSWIIMQFAVRWLGFWIEIW